MTDRAGLISASVHHEPFSFAVVRSLLRRDGVDALAADFRGDDFHPDDRSGHADAKRYRSHNCNVTESRWVDDGRRHPSGTWRSYVKSLADPGYLRALGATLGLAVGPGQSWGLHC